MNVEKLNEISNLIDEGKVFKAHIDGMEAECKSIQKYCLDALQDFYDTFCAVCELIEKNPQIAQWSESKCAWLGNSSLTGGIGFHYNKATSDCGAWIDYISKDGNSSMEGLCRWANVLGKLTEERIVKTKQFVANHRTDIGHWITAKAWADETRVMSEVLLEGMRISAEKYTNRMKEIMNKGITAGAKTYKRVARGE